VSLAAAARPVVESSLFMLALLCGLGMAGGYGVGLLIGAGKGNRDMRGLFAFLGLLLGLAMFMIGTNLEAR
jgi:hypothetical protein